MNTTPQSDSSPHLLMWIACIAVILFSAAGIAAIMGWIPTFMSPPAAHAEVLRDDALSANAAKPSPPKTPGS